MYGQSISYMAFSRSFSGIELIELYDQTNLGGYRSPGTRRCSAVVASSSFAYSR